MPGETIEANTDALTVMDYCDMVHAKKEETNLFFRYSLR